MEERHLEVYQLPYDVAMTILKRRGYSLEQADEIIAINRGESTGDRVAEYGDDD